MYIFSLSYFSMNLLHHFFQEQALPHHASKDKALESVSDGDFAHGKNHKDIKRKRTSRIICLDSIVHPRNPFASLPYIVLISASGHMAKLKMDNEEISGDEESGDEEEDTGMGEVDLNFG